MKSSVCDQSRVPHPHFTSPCQAFSSSTSAFGQRHSEQMRFFAALACGLDVGAQSTAIDGLADRKGLRHRIEIAPAQSQEFARPHCGDQRTRIMRSNGGFSSLSTALNCSTVSADFETALVCGTSNLAAGILANVFLLDGLSADRLQKVLECFPCRKNISWSGRRGSNPQPPAWEADALPLSYSRSFDRRTILPHT